MSGHTPGPWAATGEGLCVWAGQELVADLAPTEGFTDDVLVRREEREANARLIAAAPEMLEALREAIAELADVRLILDAGADFELGTKGKHRDLIRILRETEEAARAAIAKAKGEGGHTPAEARLATAAPKLLKALREVSDFLEARFGNLHGHDWGDEDAAAVADLVDATITAATGEGT